MHQRRPARRYTGLALAGALIFAGCTGDSNASWCEDSRSLVDAVAAYRGLIELPSSSDLRSDVTEAKAAARSAARGASPDFQDAFDSLEGAVADLDRTLASYGYDLLRAQSESDSEEQEDLYVLDGASIQTAIQAAQSHIDGRCGSP